MQELTEVLPAREYNEKAASALQGARRVVEVDGNYTTVVFINPKTGNVVCGTAKRNPNADPMVPERGERIATVRAYRNYMEKGWQ